MIKTEIYNSYYFNDANHVQINVCNLKRKNYEIILNCIEEDSIDYFLLEFKHTKAEKSDRLISVSVNVKKNCYVIKSLDRSDPEDKIVKFETSED